MQNSFPNGSCMTAQRREVGRRSRNPVADRRCRTCTGETFEADEVRMADSIEMSEIEASFRNHRKEILAYCLRRLDPARADDAAAEVFAVAWRRRDDAPSGVKQLYWLYGIARNVVSNARRTANRQRTLRGRIASEPAAASRGPEYIVVRRDDKELLDAIDGLRAQDRELIMLVNWEEVPRAEIASMFGISRKAVDQRYRRALKRLAKCLPAAERSSEKGGER